MALTRPSVKQISYGTTTLDKRLGLVTFANVAADGATSDTSALQDAIGEVEESSVGRGIIMLPPGNILLNGGVTISKRGVHLVGAGVGDYTYPATGLTPYWADSATRLIGAHTNGPVIRVKQEGCLLRGFKVDATDTRHAAAAGNNFGIWIEAEDDADSYARVAYSTLEHVRILRQPNDGLILVGEAVGSMLTSVIADDNGGHGICIERGLRTGRTNLATPGIITLVNCRGTENGGHGLAVGNPDDTALPSYRVLALNFEAFENCADAAVRYNNHQVYFHSDNGEIRSSAFGGTSKAGVKDSHGGLWIAGRSVGAYKSRCIDTNQPITVGQVAASVTRDCEIDGVEIRNDSLVHAEAVAIETGAVGVRVRIGNTQGYTAAATAGAAKSEVQKDDTRTWKGTLNVGGIATGNSLTIADDAATSLQFSGTDPHGIIVLAANTSSAAPSVVAFRLGASAYCTVLSGAAEVTTGALTGTTGTDGKLTVSAGTDRLYIENRTGATRVYTATLLSLANGALT